MDIDIEEIDPERGSEEHNIVGHDSDGKPVSPGYPRGDDLGQPMDLRDGMFHYRDAMAGPMADILYEPVGMVDDDRLLDIYRFQAKRAQSTDTESIIEMAERIEQYVEARGLEKPDLSQWYAVEMPRETVRDITEYIPEFFAYAEGLDEVQLGESTAEEYAEQQMRVRFCECDLALVEQFDYDDLYEIDGPDAFSD